MLISRVTVPDDLLGGIAGQPMGVLVDHVPDFERLGGKIHESKSGRVWAVVASGRAYPVLCGDLVERQYPEGEGAYTDRCGAVAVREGACDFHAWQHESWRSMSEAEKVELERREDMEDMYR